METTELDVQGMTCGGCESSVIGALGRLEGVTATTADHQTGRVVVTHDPRVDRAAIREAILDAGYELTG